MTKQIIGQIESTNVQELAESLRDAVGTFVRSVRAQAGTPTDAQGEALALLERGGPVSIASLADSRHVKHQSMRLVVAKLKAVGLVELTPDPQDGRSNLVKLTKNGREQTANARAARTRWLSEALAATMSARELDILSKSIPLLHKIAKKS